MTNPTPLWTPSPERVENSGMCKFSRYVEQKTGQTIADFDVLYQWSIDQKEVFWRLLWSYCDVSGTPGEITLENADDMEKARWFPQARLNFARNLLRNRSEDTAVVFRAEDKRQYQLSYAELYRQVALLSEWLRVQGVAKGDRVAALIPNLPEAIVAMLATASIGAIWTSTSPDFGEESVIDRFGQTEPKVLISVDGYFYNGKTVDIRNKLAAVRQKLPSLLNTVVIPFAHLEPVQDDCVDWSDLMDQQLYRDIQFVDTGFNDPLYILYSSGTTGKPKCITHKVGGVLLQHLKEHRLHSDIEKGDRVFYFTTCGWMMWNWLVSVLASEATVILYDGSPFYPNDNVLWDYADEAEMTLFGTSAKYIDAMKKKGMAPIKTHRLDALKTLCSTGSVLSPESFDYVYEAVKHDINLASISGGTDIVSCFVLGNPMLPVYRGEVQCRGLGMAVRVFNSKGEPVTGEKGELVCTETFPSQPAFFWGDDSGEKYHNAYFQQFDNIWHHGDYVRLTGHGGLVIYGRSDATLNPGGVRIGTAEIYRHVEQLEEVIESIVIGQDWEHDVRVVLFVVLQPGLKLDQALIDTIRQTVRQKCTPRHMPARVLQVDAIPRTKSGKIVELAVREVVHDRPVKNIGALANPEALEFYRDRAELQH